MGQNDLYQKGFRNLQDARFIRRQVIPIAFQHEQWNIVVHQAHQATELLIKGIICLTGNTPYHKHEGHVLVDQLVNILTALPGNNAVMPFAIFAGFNAKDDGYGAWFFENTGYIIRRKDGADTSLASFPARSILNADRLLGLQLDIKGTMIRLLSEGQVMATATDATHFGPFELRRDFVHQPNTVRIAKLKRAAMALRDNREKAFYSERIFEKDEAMGALSLMNEANEAAACFVAEYESG